MVVMTAKTSCRPIWRLLESVLGLVILNLKIVIFIVCKCAPSKLMQSQFGVRFLKKIVCANWKTACKMTL